MTERLTWLERENGRLRREITTLRKIFEADREHWKVECDKYKEALQAAKQECTEDHSCMVKLNILDLLEGSDERDS